VTSCRAKPELAGYLTITEHVPADRRGTYLLFTCRTHAHLVTEPRPMTAEDRAELGHQRERERRALAGGPWERIQPISRHA
jgi:hypothetical protein